MLSSFSLICTTTHASTVAMYIESVPNRNSPPCILLRESYRQGGKVRKRALANLTHWPSDVVEGLPGVLKGGKVASHLLEDLPRRLMDPPSFLPMVRSSPEWTWPRRHCDRNPKRCKSPHPGNVPNEEYAAFHGRSM